MSHGPSARLNIGKSGPMNGEFDRSRVGFVVIKLAALGMPVFLLRRNEIWNDVNFLGGHQKERDKGNLLKTAERELWEELPPVRSLKDFHLEPLTEELYYGPVFSRSKVKSVGYEVRFFLLKLDNGTSALIESLGGRSRNVLVSEEQILNKRRKVSGMVSFLNSKLSGGLTSIPLSSQTDVGPMLQARFSDTRQLRLHFE